MDVMFCSQMEAHGQESADATQESNHRGDFDRQRRGHQNHKFISTYQSLTVAPALCCCLREKFDRFLPIRQCLRFCLAKRKCNSPQRSEAGPGIEDTPGRLRWASREGFHRKTSQYPRPHSPKATSPSGSPLQRCWPRNLFAKTYFPSRSRSDGAWRVFAGHRRVSFGKTQRPLAGFQPQGINTKRNEGRSW